MHVSCIAKRSGAGAWFEVDFFFVSLFPSFPFLFFLSFSSVFSFQYSFSPSNIISNDNDNTEKEAKASNGSAACFAEHFRFFFPEGTAWGDEAGIIM